jgi:hypothetical protein
MYVFFGFIPFIVGLMPFYEEENSNNNTPSKTHKCQNWGNNDGSNKNKSPTFENYTFRPINCVELIVKSLELLHLLFIVTAGLLYVCVHV